MDVCMAGVCKIVKMVRERMIVGTTGQAFFSPIRLHQYMIIVLASEPLFL